MFYGVPISAFISEEPDMTLEETFYLSQSLASVAVVGSLIYLGLQVRYAERSQRGIMQQGRADRATHMALVTAHADLAPVWRRGLMGDVTLNEEEFTQWMLICRAGLLSGEDSYMQHQAGLLSESAFASYVAGVHHFMSMPGFRAAWHMAKGQFGGDFREFVDAIVAKTPLVSTTDAHGEWIRQVEEAHASLGMGAR